MPGRRRRGSCRSPRRLQRRTVAHAEGARALPLTALPAARHTLRMKRALLHLAFLTLPSAASAQAPPSWNDFTKTFKAYADSDQVVGASVVLVQQGRVVQRYD